MLEDVLDGFLCLIEVGHLVEEPVHPALGARAVVAEDVEDQRVVHLTRLLESLNQPPDLRIRVLAEPGEDLHLTAKQLLLVSRELVPILDGFWLRSEFRPRRHNTQLDLPGQGFFAELVPPSIKLALILRDPFFRDMMGGMRGTRGEVEEERLPRRERLLIAHP